MNDSLNDKIRKASESFSTPVDAGEIWGGIEEKMTSEKDNRRFLWLFLFGLIILSFGGISYSVIYNDHDNLSENYNQTITTNSNRSPQSNTEYESSSSMNSIEGNALDQEKIASEFNSENVEKNFDQDFKTSTKESVKIPEVSSGNGFIKNQVNQHPIAQNGNANYTSQEERKVDHRIHLISKTNPVLLTKVKENNNRKTTTVELIPLSLASINKTPRAISLETNVVELKNNRRDRKWHIGTWAVNSSFGIWHKNYSTDFMSDHIDSRSSTESSLEYYSLGIEKPVWDYSNFNFYFGINYRRLNEEFTWSGSYKILEEGTYIDTILINAPGDTSVSYVNGLYETRVDRDMKVYNHYNQFEIPFGVRYRIKLSSGDVSFGINSAVQLHQKVSGYFLNFEGIPNQYSQGFSFTSFRTMGLQMLYHHQFSERTKFRIGGEFIRMASQDEKDRTAHFNLIGINTAFLHRF